MGWSYVVRAAPGQPWIQYLRAKLNVSGLNALGFADLTGQRFVPLLSAQDERGRREGWLDGLFLDFAGPRPRSVRAFFTTENEDLTGIPAVAEGLVKIACAMRLGGPLVLSGEEVVVGERCPSVGGPSGEEKVIYGRICQNGGKEDGYNDAKN
ncbi:MAG TPA: hypothetical protein EYP85_12340 [Armatimonadetes bacterium]|nr:hypothetical protein [Armatimonadota bacterium]